MLVLSRKKDERIYISLVDMFEEIAQSIEVGFLNNMNRQEILNRLLVKYGDKIEVTCVEANYAKVRLGFTASRKISIHRKEVAEQIEANKNDPNRTETKETSV